MREAKVDLYGRVYFEHAKHEKQSGLPARRIVQFFGIAMTESQMLGWFFGGCIVICLLQKFGHFTERLAKNAQLAPKELPGFVNCDTPVEAQERNEEISQFVSQYLGVKRDRLKPDQRFIDDLRVPPGELDVLLERLEVHFGIMIHRKNILTFGDLLALVQVRQAQNS